MAKYKAICVLNYDDSNLEDQAVFTHEFGDNEVSKSENNGDLIDFVLGLWKLKKGYDITQRLVESGADRINITIERIKDIPFNKM